MMTKSTRHDFPSPKAIFLLILASSIDVQLHNLTLWPPILYGNGAAITQRWPHTPMYPSVGHKAATKMSNIDAVYNMWYHGSIELSGPRQDVTYTHLPPSVESGNYASVTSQSSSYDRPKDVTKVRTPSPIAKTQQRSVLLPYRQADPYLWFRSCNWKDTPPSSAVSLLPTSIHAVFNGPDKQRDSMQKQPGSLCDHRPYFMQNRYWPSTTVFLKYYFNSCNNDAHVKLSANDGKIDLSQSYCYFMPDNTRLQCTELLICDLNVNDSYLHYNSFILPHDGQI